ncbi:hypothetical protein CRENBAI_015576 [Crenichthys baileyi]|uniref:Uncharacterized protein n=1 Tax=Crenichthys baileyi TaxID=28760 RepID=A0AAV9R473_9TELE
MQSTICIQDFLSLPDHGTTTGVPTWFLTLSATHTQRPDVIQGHQCWKKLTCINDPIVLAEWLRHVFRLSLCLLVGVCVHLGVTAHGGGAPPQAIQRGKVTLKCRTHGGDLNLLVTKSRISSPRFLRVTIKQALWNFSSPLLSEHLPVHPPTPHAWLQPHCSEDHRDPQRERLNSS